MSTLLIAWSRDKPDKPNKPCHLLQHTLLCIGGSELQLAARALLCIAMVASV
jgi:hypothetical protein